MNKNLYRIIFNKARGMLMVVADIARSGRAGSGRASRPGHAPGKLTGTLNPLRLCLWLALGAVLPVQAGVVADRNAPGNQQPTIISSANGTPQVNIQTPSQGGVSRNVYSQFDVDKKGVILNNSHANTQTQLGGMITANPWLAKGEAKVILNEVNTRDPSKLNGFIEVAGRKAQVIIANPAGITCDGCGFINANRATLTTGNVQMNNGLVTGYDVERGEIVVQGNGLDASRADHTDLIARSVKVNAGIWANELNVTTGANRVDAQHQTISAKSADSATRSAFALDVSQIGGMYAGKIRLRGTEQGLGVRNAGTIGASAGDVVVNADGSISNSGAISAAQNLRIDAQGGVSNQGTLYASGNTSLTARDAVNNSGIIAARNDTTLNAASITNSASGALAAGMNGDGKLGGSGNLTLNSKGMLTSNGQNLAASSMNVHASAIDLSGSQTGATDITLNATQGDISTANASVAASGKLSAITSGVVNNDGGKVSADKLELTARRLSNQKGTLQQVGKADLQLAMQEGINNRAGTIASNGNNLTLSGSAINNQQGSIIHAGEGRLDIRTGRFDGDGGTMVSNGSLALRGTDLKLDNTVTQAGNITIQADSLSHRKGQMTHSGKGRMQLDIANALDNQGGTITAGGNIALNAAQLNNLSGSLIAADASDLSLFLTGELDNRDGLIAAAGSLNSLSNTVDNRGGLIQGGTLLSLDTRGYTLLNADSGEQGGLLSFGDMRLTTGDIDNHNGLIAAKTLDAATGNINNQSGRLVADAQLALSSGAIDNRAGALQSGGELRLDSRGEKLDNAAGLLAANGALALAVGEVDNRNGQLLSGAGATLNTAGFDNRGGQLTALGDFSLTTLTLQNDDAGMIQSGGDLRLDTQNMRLSNANGGGITSQGNLTLFSGDVNNQSGFIISNQQLTFNGGAVNNRAGQIVALGGLSATSLALDNTGGTLQSGGALHWDTRGYLLSNLNGTLSAQGALTLNAGDTDNRNGLLAAGGAINLATGALDNRNGGQIAATESLTLTSADINNQQGQIQALGELTLNALSALLNNSDGLIQGGGAVTLNAADVLNRDTLAEGKGIQGSDVSVNAGGLDNTGGKILADNALSLALDGLLNNSNGLLSTQKTASITAHDVLNTAGSIEAGENLRLKADALSGDGKLLSLGDMTLTLNQDLHNTGSIQANHDLHIATTGSVINDVLIQAGNLLDVAANAILNNQDAEISAGTTQLTAANTITNYGLIDGFYTRLNGATVNNIGSGRIYGDALAIQAGTLNNLALDGQAATIAARQRLDLGVGVLNNRDHALIYSDGSLALGGTLNADYLATGQASVLNNHSSTIESAGDMALNVATLNNVNDRFELENVLVSQEDISEYEVARLNNGVRYNDKDYNIYIYWDEVRILCIEGVICHTTDGDRFTHYQYTRTVTEDRVKESEPGKIIAGGDLSINADKVFNDKSQIVAGGQLALQARDVENVEVAAYRQINDDGTATNYWRKRNKGGDSSKMETVDYTPPTVIQGITLKPSTIEEYTQTQGSGLSLDDRQAADINGDIQGTGSLNLGDINAPGAGAALPSAPGAVTLPPGKTFEVNAGEDGNVVRITGPNTQLPDNSLFQVRPDSTAGYLVETDPRFTNNKKWLGSDYMMEAFTTDPNNVLKRLGDGYYEQKLIREQVIAMTGNRYLGGYNNDEEQYKALMNNGVEFGKKYGLTLGVALTPEQMSLLTGDMVWMVAQTVRLPDGSTQQVLVPQVYAVVKEGDLDGSGALLAGKYVALNLAGDLTNSGRINGQQSTQILADNINNLGGIIRGNDVALQARTDINNVGGMISAGQSLLAGAGRDINATTTTRTAQSANGDFSRTTIDRVAGFYVEQPDGKLVLQAGRDVNLTAAQVVNSGDGGQTTLAAGRDLNLGTVTTGSRDDLNFSNNNWAHHAQTQQVGSDVVGKGDVTLAAQHDVNITAGNVSAGQQLGVAAGNDINVQHATDTASFDQYYKTTGSSSVGSKTTSETRHTFNEQSVNGSRLGGDTVTMQAGNNLTVTGSSVAGTNDVSLSAGNNLTIQAATESRDEMHMYREKKSGISGTGGIGVSVGTQSVKTTDDSTTLSSVGSTVGSAQGNVSLTAGNQLTVKGSDVLSGQNMTLTGKEVNILAAENQSSQTHKVEQKQSGLTLALSGAAGSALSGAVQAVQDAKKEDDSRLSALQGTKAALAGVQASQALRLDDAKGAADASNNNTIGVSVSYGSQSSTSTQTQTNTTSQGSSLTAGKNLTVNATGGDLNVQGSQLQAGSDILLSAERDVNLLSGQNTSRLDGKNESRGGSVGVGISAGGGGMGVNISASANKGKGSESGNGTTHTETTVNAGNQVTIVSGRDTTLKGAQVSGERVKAEVGRDLTLISEQDSDRYDMKQQNVSGGISVPVGTGIGGSLSVNASQDKMHSNYDSVQEQTGIFAGKGGFDITVGKHTQLDGAVIGSTATSDKNRLDTGTLGFSDIENKADFKVEHQSAGMSTGGSIGGQFAGNMANSLLVGADNEGHASSTTKSAVSEGTITIRDKENQQQDVADLSRDVEHANQTLSPIFDKEKEQERLKQAQLIGEIGNQVADIARTEGDIAATRAANEKLKNIEQSDVDAAKKALAQQGKTDITDKDIQNQIYQTAYDQAMNESGFGTGGKYQQAIQAATAAVQGLAGGDLKAALAGGAAPYLAEVVKSMTTDPVTGKVNAEANLTAHAILNAALALAQDKNAMAGAAGALTGEAMGMLALELYGKKADELTETQKQTISAFATLAAGLAGGLAGDSTADVVAGAQAGKTTVENNSMGAVGSDLGFWFAKIPDCDITCKGQLAGDIAEANAAVSAGMINVTGLSLLTAEQAAMWALGAGMNTAFQYADKGEINPVNAVITGWANVASMGHGFWGTVGWNAGGGALINQINGDDPLTGAITTGAGAGLGYGVGNYLVKPAANSAGKWLTGGWDPKFDPNWLKYTDIRGQLGVRKDMLPNNIPGALGNTSGSFLSEFGSSVIQDKIDGRNNKK
ncbi:hemagglutinin repeat-containing protein [Enterobacillus tribolii]|uniref:Filamentous hemagglutinin n=1 Tax=Enterobacillus tribolii TaxID=1487935 RepID=A0A370QGJ8_9GAMM|nr:hemagglutinin repeat-containing protein [Enterobacillus tribolii]MBW7981807.1 filamentous hemagglutinin N-terminal domain-containing protein [Enterobacillus tribolii]RDK87488.1 filamentous hemagglutinin [Enterobacillus tribolii]